MTLEQVAELIESIGLPWCYSHFPQTPELPYVVYYYPGENDVHADDSNYVNKRQMHVELFTAIKDPDTEAEVEAVLRSAGLTWYKQTDFLNDEQCYQTTYEMEVLINGE